MRQVNEKKKRKKKRGAKNSFLHENKKAAMEKNTRLHGIDRKSMAS